MSTKNNKEKNFLQNIIEDINLQSKRAKNSQIKAYFLTEDIIPADIVYYISTGSTILDIAISNKLNGGIPVSRITEITGLESSGKSLLAAHILANTQKMGGVAVYIDTEASVSREFLSAIGIDLNSLIYIPLETVEDIFETIENIIESVRKYDVDKIITIVVDSIAAASTKAEIEGSYEKEGYATDKAIIISKAMRKITNLIANQKIALVLTNQLRRRLDVVGFGADPYTTSSGGMAIAFHSSVRLRLKMVSKIKKDDKVIGIKTKATVIKNRIGPPLRSAEFDIYFDSGIDDASTWINLMKEFDIVKQSGAWLTYVSKDGKEIKFNSKDFKEKIFNNIDNINIKNEIYNLIANNLIMQYKSNDIDISGIEYENESIEI